MLKKGFVLNNSFKSVNETGVIKVMSEAVKRGYKGHGIDGWFNLGQGMPEPQKLSPEIFEEIINDKNILEYSPVSGRLSFKNEIVEFYHKYTNVQLVVDEISIAPGGRSSMSRILAILAPGRIGTFEPDYTAYFEAIDSFSALEHVSIGNRFFSSEETVDRIVQRLIDQKISYFLLSNPCNPTGETIKIDRLTEFAKECSARNIVLIVDEFYSHWSSKENSLCTLIKKINDLDKNKIIILDGMTKNWMSPGLRVSWIISGKQTIRRINSAASFLDGGCSNLSQKVSEVLMKSGRSYFESQYLREYYSNKKDLLQHFIIRNNLVKEFYKEGHGFYIWGKVNTERFSNDHALYEYLLSKKIISVPGRYFFYDGKRSEYIRFSFGPNISELPLEIY